MQDTQKGSLLSFFISSPRNGSPNYAQPSSPRSLSSPRTPFATVSNLIRTASPNMPRPMNEVSQDLQDFYYDGDPFANHSEMSFMPSSSFGTVLTATLDDFAPYYRPKRTHRRMLPLKRKTSYDDLRSVTSPISTFLMQTTIYDLAISLDFPSALVSPNKQHEPNEATYPCFATGCLSPKIMLTSPSIPSSSTKTISVAKVIPTDLPVGQESSHRLQVPAKHIGSGANVRNPFTLALAQLNMADEPAAAASRIYPESVLIGESSSFDMKGKQDQEDTLSGSGLPTPLVLNLCALGAYRHPANETSLSLRRKLACADLRHVTPTKKPLIVKLDTNVCDLCMYLWLRCRPASAQEMPPSLAGCCQV